MEGVRSDDDTTTRVDEKCGVDDLIQFSKTGISINQQMPTSGEGDEYSNSTGYLRTALDNFNSLYKEKLRMIENVGAQGDMFTKQMVMEKKASILECWAKDVCVQNIVLIHTVEELEKQGEEKLKLLQLKIGESAKLAKKHMAVVETYENRIKTLMNEKAASLEDQQVLKRDLDKVKTEYKRIRGKVGQLEKDNDNLVTLITRIRDMGVWDVAGLELHRRTYTQIFGLYPNLAGSEVQTVFTRERAKSILETEEKATKLDAIIAELRNQQKVSDVALISKDSKISELENQFRKISEKLQVCQEECEHYQKLLIETQEKLLEATKQLQIRNSRPNTPNAIDSARNAADSARHAEIQELLHELRMVKAQLNVSVTESQSAKEETSMIRKEFSDRLRAMQESQQCLQTEISHSFENQHQVQEKEVELVKVKEQIHLYKSKYESTEKQLNKKDQIIGELQNTIKHLNDKELPNLELSQPPPAVSVKTVNKKNFVPSLVHCGRDHSTKAPSQLTKPSVTNRKPPWNHHFIKSSTMSVSNLSSISSFKSSPHHCNKRAHSQFNLQHESNNVPAPPSVNDIKSYQSGKTTLTKAYKSPTFPTASTYSLCSCDINDIVSDSVSPSEVKTPILNNCPQNGTTERLSKIKNRFDLKTEIEKCRVLKEQGLNKEKLKNLPQVTPTTSATKRHPISPKKKESNFFPKVDNPLAHNSPFELLMDIAVEASKNLMDSTESVGVNNRVSAIRVSAGYKKKHKPGVTVTELSRPEKNNNETIKLNSNTRNVLTDFKKTKCNQSKVQQDKDTNSKGDFKSASCDLMKLGTKPCGKTRDVNSAFKISKSFEDLLAELPEQSYMNVVNDWIKKSSADGSQNSSTTKPSRSENPLLRKTIAKTTKSKPLASGRRAPVRPGTGKSNVTLLNKKNNWKLAKEISDIKEEWNRIFSTLDTSSLVNDLGGDSLGKDASSANHTTAFTSVFDEDDQQSTASSETLDHLHTFGTTNGHRSTTTLMSKTDRDINSLTQEFQTEKAKLTESFKKEIRDKDIEITMQKLTIQHLQDALVALKRGQPFPVPDSSLNANGINGGKVFDI